jgi:hypothetical protein
MIPRTNSLLVSFLSCSLLQLTCAAAMTTTSKGALIPESFYFGDL